MTAKTPLTLVLALAAAAALEPAREAAALEPASTTVPAPGTPEGTRYDSLAIARIEGLEGGSWRYASYTVDMPGFPLPLFSDPDRRDETTAHLTFCGKGATRDNGTEFAGTYYYDETPDGDFDDLDTFCGGEEGVRELGGHVTTEPIPQGAPFRYTTTGAVTLEGADGRTVEFPAPEGTEYIAIGKTDPDTGLRHGWGFVVTTAE